MHRAAGRVREETLPFPMLVTFGALAAALLLFLTNAAPALQERQRLEHVEREMNRELRNYVQALIGLRRQYSRRDEDAQALLVSIDELGLTPAELLALHPQPDEGADNTVDRQQLRHVRGN